MGTEFDLTLAAQSKSTANRRNYLTAVRQLAAFLAERGMPLEVASMAREHIEAFIAHLLATRSPATDKARYGGLQVFFGWLRDEREVAHSLIERMKPPAVPEVPVPVLDDDEI